MRASTPTRAGVRAARARFGALTPARAARRLALFVAALGLLLPAAASAAPRLRVASASYAHPGGRLAVVVHAKRRGRGTAALSKDRRLGKGDVVISRRLSWRGGRHGAAAARLTVPASTPPATYRLLVCPHARRARCGVGAKVHVTPAAVGTRDLIDRAVAAHKLSASRALVYRVWATFGDRRLPAAYHGDLDGAPDDRALAQAAAARSRLRARDRRSLAPYLLPPIARGSWMARGLGMGSSASLGASASVGPSATAAFQQASGRSCEAQGTSRHWGALTGRHVRVWWWREHAANRKAAAGLVKVADRTIWPAYAKLMGRTPPSDSGKPCDGGDGHYDVYLLPDDIVGDGTLRGVTLPFGPKCTGSPSFTEIGTHGGADPPTRFELAHELFHAFQNAFGVQGDCRAFSDHLWFDEASAVWASTLLFPHEDGTHAVPTLTLEQPFCSIDDYSYDAFPFVLDIQRRYGLGTVPAAYRAFARANTLHGIDAALPGGFAATWRTFTRDGWNQDPVGAPFAGWYDIATKPADDGAWCGNPDPRTLDLHGAHAYRTPIHLESLASLSRRYDDLRFAEGVHEVTVHNHTTGNGRSDLQAFLQMRDGTWQVRDLSDAPDTTYCLDAAGQRVQRMVLAYGDHSIDNSMALDTPGLIGPRRGIPDSYDHGLTVDVRDSCSRFFRVTAVSGSFAYDAHYSAGRYTGDTCTITGTERDTIALDPSGHLGATDGHYADGALVLSIPTHTTGALDYHSDGCDIGGATSCHLDVDESGGPLATAVGDASAPNLEVQIGAGLPHLLNGCAGEFKDAGTSADVKLISTTVATSALTSGQPFTLSWAATADDGQRSTTRRLTATVVPVAEDGGALSPHADVVEGALG